MHVGVNPTSAFEGLRRQRLPQRAFDGPRSQIQGGPNQGEGEGLVVKKIFDKKISDKKIFDPVV